MNATRETWKPVVGYEGLYEVSDHGRVWRLERWSGPKNHHYLPKMRKPVSDKRGYQYLSLSRDGKNVTVCIHWLVAEAFIGPRPEGTEVCHRDSNPSNNRADNLRYGTALSNSADMVNAGRSLKGERHPLAKLTEESVRAIRADYAAGLGTARQLATKHGVPFHATKAMLSGRNWAWLD